MVKGFVKRSKIILLPFVLNGLYIIFKRRSQLSSKTKLYLIKNIDKLWKLGTIIKEGLCLMSHQGHGRMDQDTTQDQIRSGLTIVMLMLPNKKQTLLNKELKREDKLILRKRLKFQSMTELTKFLPEKFLFIQFDDKQKYYDKYYLRNLLTFMSQKIKRNKHFHFSYSSLKVSNGLIGLQNILFFYQSPHFLTTYILIFLLIFYKASPKNLSHPLLLKLLDKQTYFNNTFIYFCYFIYSLMNKNEDDIIAPILLVKNIPDQGLRISWNLNGILLNNNYQNYHLFLPIAIQFDCFRQFFNTYYQSLRQGDLVGIYRDNMDSEMSRKIKWTEKTAFGIEKNFLKAKYIWKDFQIQNLNQFLSKIKKFKGLITLNIFFQSKSNIEKSIGKLKENMVELRKKDPDLDKVVINVISDYYCESMLNSIQGLNYFYFQQQNVNTTIQQVFNYLKILRLKKLKIQIYFNKNYNFSLGSNSDWTASEDSYIEKVYYSVPSCRFNEYFIFLLRTQGVQIDIDITITLSCSLYNGNEIKAKNSINFTTNSSVHKAKTWNYYSKELFGMTKLSNKESIMSSFGEKYNQIWILMDPEF